MKIATLQKKIQALEMQRQHLDPVAACLDCLNDSQLDALQEYCECRDAGFPAEEIQAMMQERWAMVLEAQEAMNKRYQELVKGKPEQSKSKITELHNGEP